MPLGLNRTDLNTTGTSYRNGTPITEPHEFGTPITEPHDFGNDVTLPHDFGNDVTLPKNFGNVIGPPTPPPPTGPTLIAKASASTGGTAAGTITTAGVDTTGATFLVAVATQFDGSYPIGFSDSNGNTWNVIPIVNAGAIGAPQIAYSYQGPGGIGPVVVGAGHTVTAAVAGGIISVAFSAWSGVKTSSDPFESYSDASPSFGVTVQPGSVTPVAVNDLFLTGFGGIFGPTPPITIDSSFTYNGDLVGTSCTAASAYLVATALTAVDPTWTVAADGNRIIASIAVFAHA